MSKVAAIAVAGALGAVARYYVCIIALRVAGPRFAWGVLCANVLGCLLLGLLMHATLRGGAGGLSPAMQSALGVGFLGAFTTFSTFGVDTIEHWQAGEPKLAIANVVANLVLGLAAVLLGQWLGNSLLGSTT
jgi:CrcB protein